MQTTDLGLSLKLARIKKRLLARDVAARADLSPSSLSDFENGWREPTPEQLARICAVIGVSPEDLVSAA